MGIAIYNDVKAQDIPTEVVDWMEANVVKIDIGQGTGSGFFINPNTVVTACHVANNWKTLYLEQKGNDKRYPAEVVACDEEADIALLKLEKELPDTLRTVIGEKNPRVGKTTYGGGYPLGLPLTIMYGHWQNKDPESNSIMNSAHVVPGDSGGPLVIWEDGEVKVVGVRTGMYRAGPRGSSYIFPKLAFVEGLNLLRPFLGEYYIDENT